MSKKLDKLADDLVTIASDGRTVKVTFGISDKRDGTITQEVSYMSVDRYPDLIARAAKLIKGKNPEIKVGPVLQLTLNDKVIFDPVKHLGKNKK